MSFKDNFGIIIIIILFLFANLIFLSFYKDIWWDSSVYIGMGKYIYSLGKSGLWEESRPLILPLILGIGRILNFNMVHFGRIVSVVFAVLVILVTYKIGIRFYSKKIGLLAAFFTAFSYTFLFFSSNILTEIPSAFFALLAFYYFLNNRFFLMGLFSGIAIMTRLFQFFTLIGLGLIFIAYAYKKPNFVKKLSYAIIGALIPILPYMLLNYYLYKNIFLPFKVQTHLTQTTGWMLYREFGFYFIGLLRENFFVLFLLFLPLFFKRNYRFYAFVAIPLMHILIFSFAKHKEMRFTIAILPFLYLIASYCMAQIYNKINYKKLASGVFFILMVVWLIMTFNTFANGILYKSQRNDEPFLYFQDYLKNNKENTWVTNPLYALYSNGRVDGLLYFYSSQNLVNFINQNKNKVEVILFNSCDIPCPPAELDALCAESRKTLQNTFYNFKKIYENEINSCKYEIYRKATS